MWNRLLNKLRNKQRKKVTLPSLMEWENKRLEEIARRRKERGAKEYGRDRSRVNKNL